MSEVHSRRAISSVEAYVDSAWPGDGQLFTEVFEGFPDGIVVVDHARRLLACNAAVDELAALPPDIDPPGTCCDLFGCRRRQALLDGVCLTEMVTQARHRLLDILVAPPRGPMGQLWITAVPLGRDARRIMYQLRPAANDRRPRATAPNQPLQPRLEIQVLGPLRIISSRGPVGGEWVSQRSGQLLKFLVTERHRAVPLESVADAVWPHASFSTQNTVRHCIHVLRSNLEPEAGKGGRSPYIIAENGGYRLNPKLISVDVDEFERAISEGLRALGYRASTTAIARFKEAVAMYRGDYLADEPYSEWTLVERERLRDLVTVALRALTELCSDDIDVALSYAERLADMEPFDNEIQRRLMALLIAQGRRSRAARQYQIFEQRLLRTFNETPSFSLPDVVSQSRVQWERHLDPPSDAVDH